MTGFIETQLPSGLFIAETVTMPSPPPASPPEPDVEIRDSWVCQCGCGVCVAKGVAPDPPNHETVNGICGAFVYEGPCRACILEDRREGKVFCEVCGKVDRTGRVDASIPISWDAGEGWRVTKWGCRHQRSLTCAECYAADKHPFACPECGEECELT